MFALPMDVRCERCQTDYQFEEARIPPQGLSMRCSTCGHVLNVQKGVTPPAAIPLPAPQPGGGVPLPAPSRPPAGPSAGARPTPEATREWKIRQPGGNLFTFKELTTLQKWIVERKVNRDDEISLNGESWRKLGAIGELSVFFQVVDEAQRAAQLTPGPRRTPAPRPAAPASVPLPAPSIHPSPLAGAPTLQTPPVATASIGEQVPLPAPRPAPLPPEPSVIVAPDPPPISIPLSMPPPRAEGMGDLGQLPLRPPEPSFSHFSPALAGPGPAADFDDFDNLRQSSRAGRNLALGMLGLVGVLGAFYLYRRYEEDSIDRARIAAVVPKAAVESAPRPSPPSAAPAPAAEPEPLRSAPPPSPAKVPTASPSTAPQPPAVATRRSSEAPAQLPQAPPQAQQEAPPTPADPSSTPSSEAPPPPPPPAERPPESFDTLVRRGDKLREQEKPEQALELYGRAADLKPTRAEPIAGKGLALFDMGQKLPAEAAFKRALELDPKSGTAMIGLAETYRSLGRTEEAIAYYEKYLNTLPDGPEAGVARSSIRRLKEP